MDKLLDRFDMEYFSHSTMDPFWVNDDIAAFDHGYFFRKTDMQYALKTKVKTEQLLDHHEYACENESDISLQDYIAGRRVN